RPPTARSRTSVSRRPLETARTPHSGHPTTSVVVSTSIHTSPSTSTLTSTRNPRMPNRTAAGSIPSTMTYGLLSQRLVATTKRSEAMGHITVFPDSPDAPSPPTRREEPVSLLAIALVVLNATAGATTPESGAGFSDVGPYHLFAEEIDWLAASGITRGCNPPRNDRFCPDDYVTRGQMAAFLTRALELEPADHTFTDTAGHVFADDVAAL